MVVLFFYPHDFSFICPTEVVGFHKAREAFAAEHTSIVAVSIDDVETHLRWAHELGGISYPLLADEDGALARAYGVFDESAGLAMRATFILDSKRDDRLLRRVPGERWPQRERDSARGARAALGADVSGGLGTGRQSSAADSHWLRLSERGGPRPNRKETAHRASLQHPRNRLRDAGRNSYHGRRARGVERRRRGASPGNPRRACLDRCGRALHGCGSVSWHASRNRGAEQRTRARARRGRRRALRCSRSACSTSSSMKG